MNNKRNKRPVRTQRNRSVTADGVYNNSQFMHTVTSQVGTIVRLKTKGEDVWEGVFKTFSSSFEVVLEVATLIGKHDTPNATAQIGTLVDRLIFPCSDIVSISAKDVDLEYPTRDTFQTDSAISARLNGASREEKELEPWEEELNGTDTPLELDSTANGWDANDMFKKNELEYGVTSTFDHSLRGYTVALQHSDTPDYKEAEAKANQIANEIESQPSRKARLELENGDEETIYAAVVRPSEPNGKYIPPAKRKNLNTGKVSRSSPPPNSNSAQCSSSNSTGSSSNSVMTPPIIPPSKGVSPTSANNYPQQSNVNSVPVQHMPPPQGAQAPQSQLPPPNQVPVQQPMQAQVAGPSQPPAVQNQGPHPQRPNHYGGRQGGPKGQHMNGESKQMMRGPRNAYAAGPPPNVPPQQVQQPGVSHAVAGGYQGAEMQPKMVEMNHNGHGSRHHREEVKDLQQFSQDFQLGSKDGQVAGPPPQQQQAIPEQQVMQPCAQPPQQPNAIKSPTQALPQQPSPPPMQQQPQQDSAASMEKVTTALKKSTLNPNAKEFVLNPTAKPFMPSFNSRSPSTPSLSRPHTPQTPSHTQFIQTTMNGPMGQPPASMIVPMGYMMQGQPQYPQQNRSNSNRNNKANTGNVFVAVPATTQIRNEVVASQIQVAAATGQPLLAPGPQYHMYPTGLNPNTFHQMHSLRMYESPPQLQYIQQQQSQAGPQPTQPQYVQSQPQQAPPQQYQAAPPQQGGVQTHQYLPMCNLIPQPHMLQGMQYLQQVPPPQHQIPHTLILHNQQHQVHQGPA